MKKLALLVLLVAVAFQSPAATFTIDKLSFDTIGVNECVVYATNPFNLRGSIDIPSHVEFCGRSFAVTSIRGEAFRGSKISSVKIPSTVKEIGPMAFQGSKIKKVEIPSSINIIQQDAFRLCKALKTVKLHEGLQNIESEAFSRCHNLRQITIPASVRFIGDYCFGDDVKLRNVQFLGEPDSCGAGVFIDCRLKMPVYTSRHLLFIPYTYRGTYVIPDKITAVPGGILEFCNQLDTIIFPESIETICIDIYTSQQHWIFLGKNPPALLLSPLLPDLYTYTNEHISFFVPQSTRDIYRAAPSWQGITNITEK